MRKSLLVLSDLDARPSVQQEQQEGRVNAVEQLF